MSWLRNLRQRADIVGLTAPCGEPGCEFQQRHTHYRGFFGKGRRYVRFYRDDLWQLPRGEEPVRPPGPVWDGMTWLAPSSVNVNEREAGE